MIENLDASFAPSEGNWLVCGNYAKSRLSVLKFPYGDRLQLQEISERQAKIADWRAADTQLRADAETREICCTR